MPQKAGSAKIICFFTLLEANRTTPMEEFARIKRLPPYVFNITGELKAAARKRGEDIIDLSAWAIPTSRRRGISSTN